MSALGGDRFANHARQRLPIRVPIEVLADVPIRVQIVGFANVTLMHSVCDTGATLAFKPALPAIWRRSAKSSARRVAEKRTMLAASHGSKHETLRMIPSPQHNSGNAPFSGPFADGDHEEARAARGSDGAEAQQGDEPDEMRPSLFSQIRGLTYELIKVAVLVLLLRAYVLQASSVEGQSMQPTLHDRDMLLVERFSAAIANSPNWLRWAIPDAWEPAIERGDIVVLASPENGNNELVKRVIAVEGDRLFFYDGQVWVNGVAVQEAYLFGGDHFDERDLKNHGRGSDRMPSVYTPSKSRFESERESGTLAELGALVPTGCVFVMGDNREYEKSNDSRAWARIEIGSNSPGAESGSGTDHLWATKRDVHGRVVARLWPLEYDERRGFWVK